MASSTGVEAGSAAAWRASTWVKRPTGKPSSRTTRPETPSLARSEVACSTVEDDSTLRTGVDMKSLMGERVLRAWRASMASRVLKTPMSFCSWVTKTRWKCLATSRAEAAATVVWGVTQAGSGRITALTGWSGSERSGVRAEARRWGWPRRSRSVREMTPTRRSPSTTGRQENACSRRTL